MARTRQALGKPKQARLVVERLRTERVKPVRERLKAVKLGFDGQLSLEEIAAAVGRSRSVIQEWFDQFRRGGVAGLLTIRRGRGPASRLTPRGEEFLRSGVEAGRWRTAREVHRAL